MEVTEIRVVSIDLETQTIRPRHTKDQSSRWQKRGIKVIMAVRNIQKGEEAKNEIIRNYENANLVIFRCDLASLESVKQFSGEVHKKFDQVYILVNNAGAFFTKYIETEDGLERQSPFTFYAYTFNI